MKSALIKHRAAKPDLTGVRRVLPQIQTLIEASRQHIISTANLTLVWLYWNVGRVITEDIQQHPGRADYGEQLLQNLATLLTEQHGKGYSISNLWDMRRFFEAFRIAQPAAVDFQPEPIPQPLAVESSARRSLPPLMAESSSEHIGQPPADESALPDILQPVAVKSSKRPIRQPLAAESEDHLTIDFSKHFRLGWTHYRILLSVEAGLKRGFYFEQAAQQRWSKRELQRQIDRALFERVALSRDTKALVRLEKQRGPVETVRYEDAFKDPYLLDFLGLKGAYSEKDFESAILANLQQFLTELVDDISFIRCRYPMRIDDGLSPNTQDSVSMNL